MNYGQHYSTRETPQSEQADPRQKQNNAGGFAFTLDDWGRLRRFLILGSEGGTYYVGERKLTRENAACVERCVAADYSRTVEEIASISESGRAPKNDAAIFALAICAGSANLDARKRALGALHRVCRTGTHLFQFVQAVEGFRGWGRGLRTAIGRWYTSKPAETLAYQALKYQQRGGWSHKDLLRLVHVGTASPEHQALLRYLIAGLDGMSERAIKGHRDRAARAYGSADPSKLPRIVEGFERVRADGVTASQAAALITEYGLTHEMVPSTLLASPVVWGALLECMPMTAMIRNLGRMTANGLLAPLSPAVGTVVSRLADVSKIRKARVHPLAILIAQKTYAQGHGDKGKLSWSPISTITDALDGAFYSAFESVETSGAATLLALDVSGSMDSAIAGTPITCREGAAVMAMVTARKEPNHHLVGFTAGANGYGGRWGGSACGLTDVPITSTMRLADACAVMRAMPMGGTDCALPMVWAQQKGIGVDVFAVYTDNETWHGAIHPHQALTSYRQSSGRTAKLAVIGMAATEFTIAKPDDPYTIDVVGFDAATPALLADFSRGGLAPRIEGV